MTPSSGLVDVSGRPLTRATVPQGILNENAHHWTRYQVDAYYNPDSISLSTYEQMYNTDETCFSGIEFLIMSAVSQIGEYSHPNPKIQEFVQRQLVEMRGSFPARIAEIMTAAPFGFSLTEIIWKVSGREIGLGDLQTLHPSTIHLDLHRSGPLKNQPRCAWQFFRRDKQVMLPLDKCILYSHGAVFGNAYGTSRLKRAYKSWYIKDKILMAWALCCERYGTPYTVGKTDASGVVTGADGKQISAVQNMLNVLNSFGPKGSGVIDLKDLIEVTYAGSGYGTDFENLVAYCNKMIYRAIGLPSLIADHGNSGSYSLGQQHFKLFVLVLEKILFEVLDVIIEQLIRPLVTMNFGQQDDYGDFNVEDFSPEDAKTIAETAEVLARSGFISAAKIEDCNIIRERTGMPLWSEEDFEPSVPPAVTDTEEEPSTDQPTEDEIDESREIAKVYRFSHGERMRAARETRRKRWRGSRTEAEIDRMANLLSRFTG